VCVFVCLVWMDGLGWISPIMTRDDDDDDDDDAGGCPLVM